VAIKDVSVVLAHRAGAGHQAGRRRFR